MTSSSTDDPVPGPSKGGAHPADDPPHDPPLSSLMSGKVIGIVPEARLATALHVMASAGVRHLPVIAGEECLGVLVESDLIERVAVEGTVASAALLTQVREVCRPAVLVRPTSVRSHAAKQMITSRTDAVLVADGGRIVGIVTASDLVRSIASIHPAPEIDAAVQIGS